MQMFCIHDAIDLAEQNRDILNSASLALQYIS